MEACGALAAARRLVLPSTAQGAGAWPLAGHVQPVRRGLGWIGIIIPGALFWMKMMEIMAFSFKNWCQTGSR